jgi:prolyl oligopeptidase
VHTFSRLRLLYCSCVLALSFLHSLAFAQTMNYPNTRKSDQLDDYHGVKVADPYRWLEDDHSAETAAWVTAENEVTFAYLNKIPYRAQVKKRLEQLFNYPKYTAPIRRGDFYFYSKNDGLQNQNVLYIQKGLDGAPQVLIDPNRFSADGTSRLGIFDVSKNGRYLAYGISSGGSDWQEVHVLDVTAQQTLPEILQWVKVSDIGWAGDGFFYSRYPAPDASHTLSSKNEYHAVYYHKVATPQSADELIYEDKANPERFFLVSTTEDQRYAVLTISDRGKGKKGNALSFRDLGKKEKTFVPLVAEVTDDDYQVVDDVHGKFLVLTNHNAPNNKIALFNPANGSWSDVVAEKPEVLERAITGGGKLFVAYLKDVASHIYMLNLEGKPETEVKLPGAGSILDLQGNARDAFVFFEYTSLNYPTTVFRYDSSDATSIYRAPKLPGFDPDSYETKQVFYRSKDGTRIPMFLTYKKGLRLDGENPALLSAYGGFNVSVTPAFRPLLLALLEQGFVYASANLRGGGEYGEKWHEAGTKLKKQNVFDDFIGAAEWLIANKYTSPAHLAITGGSNGGLLVGAAINQRSELFRAAVPQVGVMDMLRFQKFTIGWNWIPDYGSSDNPEEFKALYAYSPLHNIRAGGKYPATLITTADHDDRVVPAHSFKYAATLQALANHENPVLIRIDTKSGHGASSTTKAIELTADVYSFLFYTLGVTPRF